MAYLAQKGFYVIGVDKSPDMVKVAKKKYPSLDFRVGDMRQLKFNKGEFDGIVAAYSLIHLPKPDTKKVLQRLNFLLKKGGLIYIVLQEGKTEETEIKSPFAGHPKIFLNVYSQKEFGQLLKETGFTVLKDFKRKPTTTEFQFNKYYLIAKKVA